MKKFIKKILYYLPRKFVTKIRYKFSTGKSLNLNNPEDFNEKIMYLMLMKFSDKETECADKYMVRKYVKSKGLEENLIKLFKKYNDAKEIDFEKLPNKCVLKPNNGCGSVYIIDKKNLNLKKEKKIIKALNKSISSNYAKETLEYQYDEIKPCIICEEYLQEENKKMPTDYKIFCFNGKAKFLLVCGDRDTYVKKVYYDLDWKKINCTKNVQSGEFIKPQNFEKMIQIAEKLSEDFKFVRVDLYNISGKIYFGELTFTPRGGINNTIKQDFLNEWGKMINLD